MPDSVTATEYAEWAKVNVCENGGSWMPKGSAYPDGLGISAVNWYGNGGTSDLSPDAQILVAERIEAVAGRAGYVPDQEYCASW